MLLRVSVIFVPTVILSEQFETIAKSVLNEHSVLRYCGEIDKKNVIVNFCDNYNSGKKIVVICTYDSANDLYNNFNHWKLYPDINVYDEAHNTCVVSKYMNEPSSHRDIIFLCSKYKLFATATQKVIKSEIKKVKVDIRLDEEDIENVEN